MIYWPLGLGIGFFAPFALAAIWIIFEETAKFVVGLFTEEE